MANTKKRTVLITGCSDGSLGAAFALAFAKHNFHVFATLRNTVKAASLASHPDIDVLPLEVTSSSSISSCAAIIEKKTGGKLDVLVNNAGVMFIMPLLDTDIEESKKLFDVNVWGLLAVTQAFAPMLVRSKGVVMNISSIAGAVRLSWQGSLFLKHPMPIL
jgi:1-acylglycerone phosphate reductase